MSQVETVALWAGLIASIAGIVLSIVATIFAIYVSKESSLVNQQMIRSLQKIETTVEHLSADTRELITAGWNKMLAGLGAEDDGDTSEAPDEISSGIASEVRSELTEDGIGESGPQRVERLERALEDLRETLSAQLRQRPTRDSTDPISALAEKIRGLPIEARAFISILSRGRHLTRKEYTISSINQPLKVAMKSLRTAGLLVPLQGHSEDNGPVPVYYFPPGTTKHIRVASQLAGEVPKEILEKISDALKTIGYVPKSHRQS